MIQRIQTVYLLLVAGLFIALLFLPLAFVQSGGAAYTLTLCTVKLIAEPAKVVSLTFPLAITATATAVLSLVTIFLYKNRKKQKLFCYINVFIVTAFCALTVYYICHLPKIPELEQASSPTPTIWSIFPLIALILNILAIKKISADEKLIRSLDRIR